MTARVVAAAARLVLASFVVAFAPWSAAAGPTLDLHAYWDQRCKDCHGHSGEFARRSLHVEHGQLAGAHHRQDLRGFLGHHYLAADLVAPVSEMLLAQVKTPPLFSEKCSRCHGTAAEFARKSLRIKEGVLVGRSSGRKVADYLNSHGGLAPVEVPVVVNSLTRVREEIADPSP